MSAIAVLPAPMKDIQVWGLFDDFLWYVTVHLWTNLAADSGSAVTQADAAGGTVQLTPGTTDNNEVAIATTKKPFLFADDKPAFFESRTQYAEANTSAMNMAVGFSSVMNTANMLLDDGAGPAASWSGAIIYKVDGGLVWRTRSSNGSTNTDHVTAITAGGTAAQTLRIEVTKRDTLNCQVQYFVNDVQLRDSTTNLPITDVLAYASLAQMQAGVYAKEGSTSAETLNVDYVAAYQAR